MKKYILKQKKLVTVLLSLFLLLSLVNLFTPVVNAKLLTSLTDYNINNSYKYCFIFMVLVLLTSLITKFSVKTLSRIEEKLLFDIRRDIINRILSLKTINFEIISTGEFTERIKNDPNDIISIFSIVEYNIFNVITETCMLLYVFYINIFMGIIYFIGLFSVYLYEKYAYKKIEKSEEELKHQVDKNTSFLNEIIKGIREIKFLGVINKISDISIKSLDEQSKLNSKLIIKRNNIYNNTDIIKGIITIIIIFLGIFLININKLTLTNFLIIYLYRTEIFSLILSYTSLKDYLTKYKVSKKRIMEIYDEDKYPIEGNRKKVLKNIEGKIEFENVNFSYNKNKKVIKDMSFTIKPLEDVAFIGKSGSGKSTIFNLLTNSYDNYEGKILIDGIDVKDVKLESLRKNISIISQNPYLFNMSIKENFRLLNDKLKDEEIVEACKIAQIHDDIITLQDGYDTIIGEGGTTLSGGQKQRLAIARALLKKSKILLLDEATSALDNITQEKLQKALRNISKDYTIITIAHRLSTVINSDYIYLVDDGRLIEKGNHKHLLKKSKNYKDIYKLER